MYFDVASGKQCSEEEYNDSYGDVLGPDFDENGNRGVTIQDYQNSMTGYNGTNPKDKQNSCLKFYAFNDDGGDKVNLILDHNASSNIAWISKEDYIAAGGTSESWCGKNDKGPLTLLKQLQTNTESWQGTETPSNYTMDQIGQASNAKYTIDYSSYKARLITAQEIATITGNTTWDETTTSYKEYYFNSKTNTPSDTCKYGNTSGCKYGWLYDRTSIFCTAYRCLNDSDITNVIYSREEVLLYGYWTASSTSYDASGAWYVTYNSFMSGDAVSFGVIYGVRPVIEVLKSKLN